MSYTYGGYSYLSNNDVQRSYYRRKITRRLASGVDVLECGHRHRAPTPRSRGKPPALYRYCNECVKPGQGCTCGHVRLLHEEPAGCRLCRCQAFAVTNAA